MKILAFKLIENLILSITEMEKRKALDVSETSSLLSA